MLNLVQPLPAGNAVRLFLVPPKGATECRVLRRHVDSFVGPDDPAAFLVNPDLPMPSALLDTTGLVNGTPYFYRPFYRIGGAWVAGESVSVTPAATYAGDGVDPQVIVRDRLIAGMQVEVQRGALKPAKGVVPVFTGPYALAENLSFPCISVLVADEDPAFFGIGGVIASDRHIGAGLGWEEAQGWVDAVQLHLVGVSLNPDERRALRRAIRRVIQANLEIFDALGLANVSVKQQDSESQGPQNASLYLTVAKFECLAPAFVTDTVDEIEDVTVSASSLTPSLGTSA